MASVTSSPWIEIPRLPPAPDGYLRFSRDEYHRIFEAAVLDIAKRYELLDGQIVMRSPIGPGQSGLISQLTDFFVKRLADEFQCRVQLPIIVSDHSESEPDIAVVRRHEDNYRIEHPGLNDIVLLTEVAHTSLNIDLGIKLRLYALSGIIEYWVVDVERQTVIVHREPTATGYRNVQQFTAAMSIAPLAAPQCQLDLAWLFR